MTLDLEGVNLLLTESVEHAKKFVEAPKLKEYSYKVAAQSNLRKVMKMISGYNREITNEYRKRKVESQKPKEAKIEQIKQPTNEQKGEAQPGANQTSNTTN